MSGPLEQLVIGLVVIAFLGALIMSLVGARPSRVLRGGRTIRTHANRPAGLKLYANTEPTTWIRALLCGVALASGASDLTQGDPGRFWLLLAVIGGLCGVSVVLLDGAAAIAALIGVAVLVAGETSWGRTTLAPCEQPAAVSGVFAAALIVIPFGLAFLGGHVLNGWSFSARSNSLGLQGFALVDVARFIAGPGGAAVVPATGGAPIWLILVLVALLFGGLLGFAPKIGLLLAAVAVGGAQLALATAYPSSGCSTGPSLSSLVATLTGGVAYLAVAAVRQRPAP